MGNKRKKEGQWDREKQTDRQRRGEREKRRDISGEDRRQGWHD